jgi:hypothetical protein
MMKKAIIVAVLLIMPALSLAQSLTDLQENPYSKKNSFSLLDPSRLKMRQSYTFGYYSGSGGSATVGYYLNSLEYTFSNPLRVRVDLGFLHNPSSLVSRNSSKSNSGVFMPGISLDWQPTSSFHFRLDYRQTPTYNYGGYNGYFNPGYWEDYR